MNKSTIFASVAALGLAAFGYFGNCTNAQNSTSSPANINVENKLEETQVPEFKIEENKPSESSEVKKNTRVNEIKNTTLVTILEDQNFDILKKDDAAVVQIIESNSERSQLYAEAFKEYANKYKDIKFYSVCVNADPVMGEQTKNGPVTKFFQRGERVLQVPGYDELHIEKVMELVFDKYEKEKTFKFEDETQFWKQFRKLYETYRKPELEKFTREKIEKIKSGDAVVCIWMPLISDSEAYFEQFEQLSEIYSNRGLNFVTLTSDEYKKNAEELMTKQILSKEIGALPCTIFIKSGMEIGRCDLKDIRSIENTLYEHYTLETKFKTEGQKDITNDIF
jgi:hypothetical protein